MCCSFGWLRSLQGIPCFMCISVPGRPPGHLVAPLSLWSIYRKCRSEALAWQCSREPRITAEANVYPLRRGLIYSHRKANGGFMILPRNGSMFHASLCICFVLHQPAGKTSGQQENLSLSSGSEKMERRGGGEVLGRQAIPFSRANGQE